MAKCNDCHREMLTAKTCTITTFIYPDGVRAKRLTHHGEGRCHDCGVLPGGYHHQGCDDERCPRCGIRQHITCDCWEPRREYRGEGAVMDEAVREQGVGGTAQEAELRAAMEQAFREEG